MPIVIATAFWVSVFKTHDYIESQKTQIYADGYEVGRFEQLNEDDANTQMELKKALLKNLATLESRNGQVRKILDWNNKYSLGLYHFQATTVQDMYWRYYGKKISIEESVDIANDDDLATSLAYDAIFVKGEKYHWHLSMLKLSKLGLIAYK